MILIIKQKFLLKRECDLNKLPFIVDILYDCNHAEIYELKSDGKIIDLECKEILSKYHNRVISCEYLGNSRTDLGIFLIDLTQLNRDYKLKQLLS
jgi:hypothetical protein